MSRHPGFYISTLIVIGCGHAALCYSVATTRGYPLNGPLWQVIAPYIMFCGVFVAPLFDDFQDAPPVRNTILAIFSFVMAALFAMAGNNPDVITCWFVTASFTFCLESIGRGVWSAIRRFEPGEFD